MGWVGVGWTSFAVYLFCDSGHVRTCGLGERCETRRQKSGSSLESSPNEWLIARIESGACQLDVGVLDCLENNEVGS